MSTRHKIMVMDEDRLVSVDELAERWSVSRSTVIRVVEKAGLQVLFLSGQNRGVRRYRLKDIVRLEDSVES